MSESNPAGTFSRLMASTPLQSPTAPELAETPKRARPKTPSNRGSKLATDHGRVTPRNRDTTVTSDTGIPLDVVRNAVKQLGKEAATYRFTLGEKKALRDIVYAYTNAGVRTSENEVTRIAINFLVEDHQAHGETSILSQVLEMLHS